MSRYGVPVIISINRFPSDTDAEVDTLLNMIAEKRYVRTVNTAALDGGEGAVDLATRVMFALDHVKPDFKPLYNFNESILYKISKICKEIYGATDVEYSDLALKQIDEYERMGYGGLPVCISKTPNSLTDDPKVLGAPTDFKIHIREVRLYAGAGLIVPLSGGLLLMPGLPKEPRCLDKFN